ncbi:MAG TPA: GYD domain-containing protein [Candidatus Limnocylindrales bacterium]|nr:GYD domain-containing protein [Candidatus Limnocylindrales bacterium]
MPKYLFRASYSAAGATGVLKEGGTARVEAVTALVASVGGRVESAYWTFGADDFLLIAELPDSKAAAAASMTVGASGAARVTTSELLTAADVDEIVRRRVEYRPPGG